MRYLGPVGIVIGIVTVIVGALFQIYGAAAVVFCSVIGGGLILILAGVVVWLVRAFRPHTPGPMAA